MRTRPPIALLLLLVLAAGCGSKKAATVPWTPRQPPELAERSPVQTMCRAADLAVQGDVQFTPRGRTGIAVIALRNAGTRTCRLTGRAKVRLVKAGGPRQVNAPIPRPPLIFPDTSYPVSSLLALRPGEYGGLTITWDNWCDPLIPGKPRLPPSAVRITLPDGRGSVDADYNAVPSCVDPSSPSSIGVSPFEPAKVQSVQPWTKAFVSATVPDQPVHARRGGILHFRVELRNDSQTTARFDRCPSYVQQLVPSGKVEVYKLNCSAAHPIAPGKSLAFAMQVRVPKNAPVGGNGLFWELDPFGGQKPVLHARATIDG